MIEVAPRLFVGNALDYEKIKGKPGWRVVQAAKDPYHRDALGYKGMGAPRDHQEYLFAYRDERLILNMVDVDKAEFFRPEMIDEAISFIDDSLYDPETKVLVHCNQGGSRAPSLALLYLHQHSERFESLGFDEAEKMFCNIYPAYLPARGIRDYLKAHWDKDDAMAAR